MIRRICALSAFCLVAAYAQGERGTLNGTVVDPSGAAVPTATVTAVNIETNVETKVTTTEAGVYRMPYLPRGTYRITAGASGFKSAMRDNVILNVAQTLTVDFNLEVGQITEQVTVSSDPPLLETGTAEIGRYVTTTEFNTWPIAVGDGRRQIQQFIFSSLPGTTGDTFQGSINGGQNYTHEILVEGIPLGRFDLQGGSNNEFSPSAESISEFKLQVGPVGAQYNGGQTAIANFGVKSGTNELHGTGYFYIQNEALRANSFANNAIGRARAPFKLANGGGAVGGPIFIPKVYDGRNKTFFFFNYERTRVRDFTSLALTTLPTVDMKSGDFSRLFNPAFTGRTQSGTAASADALGRPVRYGSIYDPSTTRSAGGTVVRDIFPNNVIPRARWSPVSAKILELAPITDPAFDRMLENVPNINTGSPVFDEKMWMGKLDHNFSTSHRISGLVNINNRVRNNSPGRRWGIPPGTPTGVYQLQDTPGLMGRFAYDWTVSPTILNHFAIGYNRFGNNNESVFVDQGWPEKIGLQNVPQTHFPALFFIGQAHLGGTIGADGGSGRGRLGSANRGGNYNGSTISQDDVTIIRGKHNYKAGFELRKYYYNTRNKSSSGEFTFNPLQTQLPGFADQTGHAFASFLLGAVDSTTRAVTPVNFGHRVTQTSFYFMDDWKVTRRLTLNLGIRWEIVGGLYEVAGRMSAQDLAKPNPGAGNIPGALVFADDLGRKGFQNRYWGLFAPRFGFAYAMNNKMVLRGGYGINSGPPISNSFGFGGTLGFSGTISRSLANTALAFPQDPVIYLHDRYPDFTGALPNKNPALANGLETNYIAPDSNRVGYTQNYSFGIQYLLPGSMVLETSYIGSKGTRIEAGGNAGSLGALNQLPASALRFGDALFQPLSQNPGLAPLPYPGFTGTLAQALRPFPQYQAITQQWSNFGWSSYNSLQVQLTRHFTKGLAVLAGYTWSKSMGLVDDSIESPQAQDIYNRSLERSTTSYHYPHFLKFTWIYELPVGNGKMLNVPGVVGRLLGGWNLTGIHNYRSGSPLQISTSGLAGTTLFNGTYRPNRVSGVPVSIDKGEEVVFGTGGSTQYLNPAAFTQLPRTSNNVPTQLGNTPRYLPDVRGPGRYTEDFGIMKRFAWKESQYVEVRGDFLNAFNRAGRGNPNTNITSPLFGKITGAQQGPRNIQLSMRIVF